MEGGDNPDEQDKEEQRRRWREIYGDMVPERIVDTKIGEDGKRYYKVQWAASNFEPAKNFLEAELLIRKYWDPVEKKLKFPSKKSKKSKVPSNDEEQGCSSSSTSSSGLSTSTSFKQINDQTEHQKRYNKEKEEEKETACETLSSESIEEKCQEEESESGNSINNTGNENENKEVDCKQTNFNTSNDDKCNAQIDNSKSGKRKLTTNTCEKLTSDINGENEKEVSNNDSDFQHSSKKLKNE